jgi:hypothetical protein
LYIIHNSCQWKSGDYILLWYQLTDPTLILFSSRLSLPSPCLNKDPPLKALTTLRQPKTPLILRRRNHNFTMLSLLTTSKPLYRWRWKMTLTTTRKLGLCDCENYSLRRLEPSQFDICDSLGTVDDFSVATTLCDSSKNRRCNCRISFCNSYKPSLCAIPA